MLACSAVGDTVNTASRMESNSIKNCIHMSEVAAVQLQAQCALLNNPVSTLLRCRGEIEIKGIVPRSLPVAPDF